MACNSSTMSFSHYEKMTKFKENQIRQFYLYFKKYAKDSTNQMSYMEFKNSIGILGVKSNEFICIRLFDLLCDRNTQRLSFESYLSFMNLVNYGTMEEKIAHSFKFFDLDRKGFIDRDNFRRIILSLCEYFSMISCTQMKIREMDVDLIYDEMIEKAESPRLDLPAFIRVSQNYPEILDFFDIFNNKILENMTLIVHKDSLKKLEGVGNMLKNLLEKLEKKNMRINRDITLASKFFIDKCVKEKKIFERLKTSERVETEQSLNSYENNNNNNFFSQNNGIVMNYFMRNNIQIHNNYSNNNSDTNSNDINSNVKLKMFNISDKINNKFSEVNASFSDDELDLTDSSNETEEEEHEEMKDYVYELDQVGKTSNEIKNKKKSLQNAIEIPFGELRPVKTNTDLSEEIKLKIRRETSRDTLMYGSNQTAIEEDFEFIAPADLGEIKDKDILSEIIDNSIDVNECLIITNKKAFLKYVSDMKETLKNIIEEIDPSRKKSKRRQGISLFVNNSASMEKEDFLNAPFIHKEEKGLIHFGNENVELVLNMMIGIRNSVNSIGNNNKNLFLLLKNDDAFKEVNRFKYSQNSYDKDIHCRFYDYAPKVFFNIRKFYGIKNEDYIKSLGPENFLGNLILIKNRSLRELCSSGKSGSFFYYSYDSKFVLKTISAHEFEFFNQILEDYYNHIAKNPNTLLQRFYGLHVMYFNDFKMHFVIMNNVFNTNIQVNYKYDLKGSTYQRLSRKRKENNYEDYDYNIPMKDLDYIDRNEKIYLINKEKEMICKELFNDSDFLASKNINDYSLLIGIHNPDYYNGNSTNNINKHSLIEQLQHGFRPYTIQNNNLRFNVINNNDNGARNPFYEKHKGGILSSDGKKVYFFGLIDIFTSYGYLIF